MKNLLKNKNGITLISLVVTIIILLILAGISIGMLSGDNGVLRQAGNAKTQTDIAEEKEILQTASLATISKEKYGDLSKDKLDMELNKYSGIAGTQETDEGIEVTFSSGRTYLVDSDGNVELLLAKPKIASSKIVNSSGSEVSEPEEAEQLYIIITPSIDGGTIESLICNEGNTVEKQNDGTYKVAISKNGTYTFKIVGKVDGKESISKSVPIEANSFKVKIAEDTLIINITSTNDAEISPYVNYRWKTGESPILCRVLYDKNSEYGLQIISVEPVRAVKLGWTDDCGKISGDSQQEKAMNSYNRAVDNLNEYAENYMDTVDGSRIAYDARCVGCKPNIKNDTTSSYTSKKSKSHGTVSLKISDTNYKTDETRLKSIGAYGFTDTTYANYYWLASRILGSNDFYLLCVDNSGTLQGVNSVAGLLGKAVPTYIDSAYNREWGLRPVFTLNSGVKILSGNGTIDKPYELGL